MGKGAGAQRWYMHRQEWEEEVSMGGGSLVVVQKSIKVGRRATRGQVWELDDDIGSTGSGKERC